MQFNCVKDCAKNELNVLWHSTGFPSGLSVFLVSSLCLLVRVTVVDKNKAVLCCLLATSVVMLSEKKKRKLCMWGKKWYLKWNISCDADLLNELLETDVENYINLCLEMMPSCCRRETEENVGFPEWTAQFSVWKTTGNSVLRPARLPVKTAQFNQFFCQVWRHTVKSLSLTESVY